MAPTSNRRPGFSRRAQSNRFFTVVLALAGAVVAAVLLAFSILSPTAFSPLRAGVGVVTTPISSAGAWVVRGIGAIPDDIVSYFAVRQENARLRRELTDARALITRARALAYDNRRLTALLKLRDTSTNIVTTARLVSSSASSTRRYGVLDAGLIQGVRAGMPVRDASGLIGRVVEAGPSAARVLLLTDPESVVPVRRTRDGLPAIATGRGDGLIDVKPVTLGTGTLDPGDMVVTTGTGGLYPPDIPVARIRDRLRDGAIGEGYAAPDRLDAAVVLRPYVMMLPPPPEGGIKRK